jgi:hypothetical protein
MAAGDTTVGNGPIILVVAGALRCCIRRRRGQKNRAGKSANRQPVQTAVPISSQRPNLLPSRLKHDLPCRLRESRPARILFFARRVRLWVLCHEHHRSKRRCGTVREMKEGPSGWGLSSSGTENLHKPAVTPHRHQPCAGPRSICACSRSACPEPPLCTNLS